MTPPPISYVRKVLVVKEIHDGDTYRFQIDQGVGDARDLWVRLHGIDTWELSQPGGTEARDGVTSFLLNAKSIVIQTFKTKGGEDVTTFIRYVADVWADNQSLAEWITLIHPEYVKK